MKRLLPLIALVLLSACTGGSDKPVLRVYAAVDQEVAEQVLAEFTEQTGIVVEAVYDSEAAKTAGLAKRLELEKDQPNADVWWSGESLYTAMLDAKGLFEKRTKGENWVACSARIRVLVYDESRWPGDVPTPDSVDALAAPALRGKCVIANPLFGTSATQFAALHARPEGARLLERINANDVQIVASNSAVVRAVSSGDALLGISDTDDVLIAQAEIPSLRFVIPDQAEGQRGTVMTPATAAVVRNCVHAVEACKLVDWIASKAGEAAMAKSMMRTLPIASEAEPPSELPARGKLRLMPVDYAMLAADWDKQLAFLKSTFQP